MCGDRFHTRSCTRPDVTTRGSTIEEVNFGKRILMMTPCTLKKRTFYLLRVFVIITTFADADPNQMFKLGDAEFFRLRDALNISNFRL
jgi:hypothetical protein